MKKNIIGKSKIEVCALGMGCWSYGGGSYWGDQSQDEVNRVVHYALDAGLNYFDTAEVYNDGASESSLGIALKGRRSSAVIGTKISTSNVKRETLIQHCEASLRRLQTDYIDIYMLHWPVNPKAIEHFSNDVSLIEDMPQVEEVFETLRMLKQQGKIREIGISNHGVQQMQEVIATHTDIAVNELPYNLISRSIEKEILPFCIKENIGVLGYMAYQQGILTGIQDFSKLRPSQMHSRHFKNERGGNESRHFEDGAEEEILALLDGLHKISAETGLSVPALSLGYAMSKDGISSTLVGSRTIEELQSNIQIAENVLSPDIVKQLDVLSQPIWDKLGDSPDYYENRKNSRIW